MKKISAYFPFTFIQVIFRGCGFITLLLFPGIIFSQIQPNQVGFPPDSTKLWLLGNDTMFLSPTYGQGIWYNAFNLVNSLDTNHVVDHGTLIGLEDDDHLQYVLLEGRPGGQLINGGTGINDLLTLKGTSANGTLTSPALKVNVGNNGATTSLTVLNNGNFGIGTTSPTTSLNVKSLTIGNGLGNIFELHNSLNTLRTGINGFGSQNWYLYNGASEAGSISYSTPGGEPGIAFFNTSLTGRSQIKQYDSTGGISMGATTTGSNPADQFLLNTSGNVGIGILSISARLHVISTTEQFRSGYDTNNYWRSTSNSAGLSTFDANSNGSGAAFLFTDNVGIGTTAPTHRLHLNEFNTTNSTFRVGSIEFQPYALNNSWFGENIYYNGGFKYRETGSAGLFYFAGMEGQFRFYASASAGSTAAQIAQFKVNADGTVAIGGTISNIQANYTGSTLIATGTGLVGIGTTAPDKKLELNLGTAGALRLTYNDADGSAATFADVTLGSAGNVTFDATGSGTNFLFADKLGYSANGDTPTTLTGRDGTFFSDVAIGYGLGLTAGNLNVDTSEIVTQFDLTQLPNETPLSAITDALNSNTIDNDNYPQEWHWNTLANATGLKLSSTSTVSSSQNEKLLEVSMSGAHAAGGQITVAGTFSNTHTGTVAHNTGLTCNASGGSFGTGIFGNGDGTGTSYGVRGSTSSLQGYGIFGTTTTNGIPIGALKNSSNAANILTMLELERQTTGTASSGIGGGISFITEMSNGSRNQSNLLASKWTDVTEATRTSQFIISGVNNATIADLFTLSGNGALKLNKYGVGTFTGTPTYTLAIDSGGNIIEVASGGGGGDASSTNEGILGVASGTSTSSIITSNTTGALGDTIYAATGISISENPGTNGGSITLTNTGDTNASDDALKADPLSQFASTTSSQLAGVISDETGTDKLVYSNSPTLSGIPIAPTAAQNTNSTQIATTEYVDNKIRTLSLTSNATSNSTTTGVEITGMNTTVGIGTYVFQYFISYQSSTAGTGVKFGVNHTGTASSITANVRWQESTTSASTGAASQTAAGGTLHGGGSARTRSSTSPNLGPSASVDLTNSNMLAVIEGLIIVTGSGDLELWHASETANSTTVMAGTSLILTKTN